MKTFKTLAVALVAVAALMGATRNASAQTTTQTLSSLPNFDPGTGPQARIDALTVTLDPLGGALHGKGGDTLGWGFRMSWDSNAGDYLVFTGSRLSSEVSALSTTGYKDIIGVLSGPTSASFPANTTWQQPFVAGSKGIGGLTLRSGAVGGAEFSGQIRLSFDVFDDFPDYGEKLGSFTMVVDAKVTVDMPPPVQPADQSITFDPIGAKTFGTAPFTISASAAGSLPVSFTSETAAVCTVSEATVTLASAGTCIITATQDGDDAHNAAPPVSQSFEVIKATATVTLTGALSALHDGTPKSLAASTTPGGLNVLVTYNGDGSAPTAAGTYQVNAIIDDPAYDGSASATLTITKATAVVTWNPPAAITYGDTIGALQLSATASVPGTFAYSPVAGFAFNAGTQTLSTTFTPADTARYAAVTSTVTLTVNKKALTVTANSVTRSHTATGAFTGVITGALAGDSIAATYTSTSLTTPGAYPIVPALTANAANANYAVTLVNGTLTLTNAAPVAAPNAYTNQWNTLMTVAGTSSVTANDTDADRDPLAATVVTNAAHGVLTFSPAGTFTYMPNANYSGIDTFTYRLSDGFATSNLTTVTLRVTSPCHGDDDDGHGDGDQCDHDRGRSGHRPGDGCAHDRHNRADRDRDRDGDRDHDRDFDRRDCAAGTAITKSDSYTTRTNVALTTTTSNDVLGNDYLGVTASLLSGPAHGTLTFNANGTFTYTATGGYVGTDSFVYVARNNSGAAGAAATVSIRVKRSDPPVADADSYSAKKNTTLTVGRPGVMNGDADRDGDPITAILVGGPSHGTLTLNADGSFVYKPANNYTGTDTFTYKVRDITGLESNVATVMITIKP